MEIKDVKLPVQLQRAMAAEAEASREARAKVPLCFLCGLFFPLSLPFEIYHVNMLVVKNPNSPKVAKMKALLITLNHIPSHQRPLLLPAQCIC